MSRTLSTFIVLTCFAAPMLAGAQMKTPHVTGPFVHFGGVAGSVTRDDGPVADAHSGAGWGAGGGYIVKTRFGTFGLLGSYTIFAVKESNTDKYNLEQTEAGMRIRFGNHQTPIALYLEGGGARRRATMASGDVFGDTPPADSPDRVPVEGWAGWFGPGVQIYAFGPRIPLDLTVAWAWGGLDRARVSGTTITIVDPVAVTTLRMRLGISAAIF